MMKGITHDVPPSPSLSIIVCTYNRASALRDSLKAILASIAENSFVVEVIIVDNGSTDNTKDVTLSISASSDTKIRYLYESQQGLAYARNAGVRIAAGPIVAYTDDDCIVSHDWAPAIISEFTENPHLTLLGGRVELFRNDLKPVSIRTSKERVCFNHIGMLFNVIPGCNFAFRRTLINDIGEFDTRFGAGSRGRSAEDSDFLYRALKCGYHMEYVPTILVHHNHGRTTDEQVDELNEGYVFGRGAFYAKHILRADLLVTKVAYWECRRLISQIVRGDSRAKAWFYLKTLYRGAALILYGLR